MPRIPLSNAVTMFYRQHFSKGELQLAPSALYSTSFQAPIDPKESSPSSKLKLMGSNPLSLRLPAKRSEVMMKSLPKASKGMALQFLHMNKISTSTFFTSFRTVPARTESPYSPQDNYFYQLHCFWEFDEEGESFLNR